MKKNLPYSNLLLVVIVVLLSISAQADTVGPFPYAVYFERADHVLIAKCTQIETIENPEADQYGVVVRKLQATFRPSASMKGPQVWEDPRIEFQRIEIVDDDKFGRMDSNDARMLLGALERMSNYKTNSSYMIFLRGGKSIASIEVPTYYRP